VFTRYEKEVFFYSGIICFLMLNLPCFLPYPRRYSSVNFRPPNSLSPFFSIIHSEADYLVPEQFSFCGARLLASCPTPNLEDQGVDLRLAPTP
jgi:hypothetical protein